MRIARGRFVVDTHVHAQRQQFDPTKLGAKPDYATLQTQMREELEPEDNSALLLYDMKRYGIDMCVLQPAFGMTNELNAELAKRYPDKFIAFCNDCETQRKAARGEQRWTIEAACKEIEYWLATGVFKGIGEGLTRDRQRREPISWEERFEQICQIMELARKYEV